MTASDPPPWSPDPADGADQYRRISQIVIGLDPDSGRPAVALDGDLLDSSSGWQAAVDAGFARVADLAESIGEPISVTVVDTTSDWNGRFLVQPDRSIDEDTSVPAAPRRRVPLLALLAAAAVLVTGTVVVVGTQLTTPAASTSVAAPAVAEPPSPVAPPESAAIVPPAEPTAAVPPVTEAPIGESPVPEVPPSEAPGSEPPVAAAPPPAAEAAPETAPPAEAAPPEAAAPPPDTYPPPPDRTQAPDDRAKARPVQGSITDNRGTCLTGTKTDIRAVACSVDDPRQTWTGTPDGGLRSGEVCLTAAASQTLIGRPCEAGRSDQVWRVGEGRIFNPVTSRCVLVRPPDGERPPAVTVPCDQPTRARYG